VKISYSTLYEDTNRIIKPKGNPVGIRFFEEKSEFDKLKPKKPERQLALC